MRIESIKIKNFKAIKDLTYNPTNKIAVLCAPNGTGKTSFLEALRFGLTGDAPDNCVNIHEDEVAVDMTIDGDLTFSRIKHITKPTKIKVDGKTTTAKNLELTLMDKTNIKKEAMRITTSQDVASSLKPDELGLFLMSYVPEEIDVDTVVKYIPDLTPQAQAELEIYLPAMPIKFGLHEIEEAYKRIFEARSFANKDKANRTAQIDLAATEPPARPLRDILAEEESIIKREGAQQAVKSAQELYDAAVQSRKRAEENLRALKAQIDAIEATKPNDSVKSAILEEKAKCRNSISAAKSMMAIIDRDIETFTYTLESLGKPVCPISERLICTTDKTAVKEEITELIKANEEGRDIQEKIISEATAKIAILDAQEAAWNENATLYAKKTTLVNRYSVDEKNLPAIPPRPSVVEPITDFGVRKAELKQEKAYCEAYEKNQRMLREGAIFQERYDILNSLCKALEPKGVVMNGITASYLSVFEGVINERADELGTGYAVQFIAENGVNYMIKTTKSTTYIPYDDLSHGEQLIAVFLLLDMLNSLCGTRLMLLDDINHLDSDNFNTLLDLLCSKTLQDAYDHIFLCTASNTEFDKRMKSLGGVDFIF